MEEFRILNEMTGKHQRALTTIVCCQKCGEKKTEHDEALAKQAEKQGFLMTALEHYEHAVESYRMAQHPIYYDDNPVKIYLTKKNRQKWLIEEALSLPTQ